MKAENNKALMRKGILEYCILLVLANRPRYVSDIVENLEKSRLIMIEGALYPMLTRLKNEGYLGYRWDESMQGPPRKYYELTEAGRLFMNELGNAWAELIDAVLQISKQN